MTVTLATDDAIRVHCRERNTFISTRNDDEYYRMNSKQAVALPSVGLPSL